MSKQNIELTPMRETQPYCLLLQSLYFITPKFLILNLFTWDRRKYIYVHCIQTRLRKGYAIHKIFYK